MVEQRVQDNKAKEIINKCAPGWSWCSNRSSDGKGRIWIIWDPNKIQFTMLQNLTQYIHGKVHNISSSRQFAFTAIYGLHTIAHRCAMWEALRNLDSQMTNPWLIMVDFNAIMDIEDRVNGTTMQENEIKEFRALMEDCRLNELTTVGRSYTWTNSHVYSRIDRAIVNAHWMMNMPPIQVNVMDPQFSDHSPLCIELEITMDTRGKPFKFFNYLADHTYFENIIRERWDNKERSMKGIWQNLRNVKAALKSLNRKEFASTTNKVQQPRETLASIQAQMRTTTAPADMFDTEKITKQQLEKWSKIEENIYKQRSRVQWLKLGDSNTAFFFTSMKGRTTQNQIKLLTTDDGRFGSDRPDACRWRCL
ncbi:PREDICTED: uncharacterized protein LOC109217477 [Nicotiana attenuata]|uniref:uncharacterized protein LOC109217477 n=1 Tax=Nicotiana attenuata TaxID=49451 RepID=UPI000905B2C1|nr:PREDICTED: uncharacterized protein LOC109217477 [Nicotiana attenuata]